MKSLSLLIVLNASLSISFISPAYCQIPAGGTAIIKDANTFASKNGMGTMTKVPVTGQSFTTAFRYVTGTDITNSWDAQLVFTPATGIDVNNVILVAFFARTTASIQETGSGYVTVCIENRTTYDKVIYQNVSIGTEWKQYFVPLKSSVALLVTNLNCAFHTGFASQTVEIGDVHFINYAATKTVEELPVTKITYIGQEPDAPWRAEAEERINQIRKGNIQIQVVDTFGNPVQNAEVTIFMTRQKFGFGSAIVASDYLTNPVYKKKIHELFNEVVFENDLKWSSYYYKTPAQKNDMIKVLDSLDSHNILMRGHNVLWPTYKYNPAYLADYKTLPDKLRLEIDKRIDDVCKFTRGRVVDWDVINEPYTEHEWMDLLGKEAMADWFKRVRNIDPYVKLYLNDFAILSSNGTNVPKQDAYIETVKYIDGLGGGVQGIGMQGHFGSDLTPITRLKSILDKFSVLEKEIKVTEFDIDITQDSVKADYTRDFYTMLFSHPSVSGILMWGFWESRHWKPGAAMYNADWSIRLNGEAYRDLVLNKWWTKDTTRISDAMGMVSFNGFLGAYGYKVNVGGIEHTGSFEVIKPVSEGVLNEIVLSTHPDVPTELKIKVTGETVFCEGSTAGLSVEVPPDFNIHWFKGQQELLETLSSITVGDSGTYIAEASGKGVTLRSAPVKITVNSFPVVPIDSSGSLTFCPGGSVMLNTNIETPLTYKWYKYGVFFLGSTPEIAVTETGRYKVEANSFGCKTFSPELTITKRSAVDPLCSDGIEITEKQVSVSPNPFQKSIFIDASNFDSFPVEIEFIDIKGKVVYHTTVLNPVKTEITPEISNGLYFLKMKENSKIQWQKLIRQN